MTTLAQAAKKDLHDYHCLPHCTRLLSPVMQLVTLVGLEPDIENLKDFHPNL